MPTLSPRIELPAKLRGLYEPHRYKVIHGGRGGGKSRGVAMALLEQAARHPMRVLCAREVQLSIRASVHQLLSDQIAAMGLGSVYTITRDEISTKAGSSFIFSGLSQQTSESIKSYEGIDVAWVEEGQSVSKRSWDILTPTIRKPGSEICITLNPYLETAETYQRFVAHPPADAWVQRLNWRDNPWFPDVLNAERIQCRLRDPVAYPNIWEGEPVRVAEGAIYAAEVDAMYDSGRVRPVPADPALAVDTVWDLGWNDSMAIILCQRAVSEIRVVDYIEDSHKTLAWYVQQLDKRGHRYGTDFLPHDGAAGNFATGKSTQEMLSTMGRRTVVLKRGDVEEGIRAARMVFPRVYIDEDKCGRLLDCLKRYRRVVNRSTGEPTVPLHDDASHGADAWRYMAQAADMMGRGHGAKPAARPLQDWRV